jgi:hypothetical protein
MVLYSDERRVDKLSKILRVIEDSRKFYYLQALKFNMRFILLIWKNEE